MTAAAEYLESLQREMYEGIEREPSTAASLSKRSELLRGGYEGLGMTDPKEIDEAWKFQVKLFEEADALKPSPFEDAWTYALLRSLAERLTKVLEQTEWTLDRIPVYGTLPLGELNAMALRVPESTENLIAFQHGVFGFANLLTKAVAVSFPVETQAGEEQIGFSYDVERVEQGWEENDEPLRRLTDFLGAYLVGGHPHAAKQYFLGQPFVTLASVFREAFELFIFGHELGHVIRGHLDSGLLAKQTIETVEVERLSPAWSKEFEADAIGCQLTLAAMNEQDFPTAASYCGIELFFSSILLVDRALSVLIDGEAMEAPLSNTHPPAQQRRETMRLGIGQMFGESADDVLGFARASEQVLDLMWERIRPVFERAHAKGVRPAPMWTS